MFQLTSFTPSSIGPGVHLAQHAWARGLLARGILSFILRRAPMTTATSASRRAPALASTSASDDTGKLLLRLTLGALILLHGIAKLTGGVDFVVDMVGKAGLPGALGYLVYVGEVLAPLLLIAGLWTRV